jgi:putative sigma-54 modulation protein
MRLDITGRHFTVSAATRKFAEQRLAHAVRLLNNSAVSAHVALAKERGRVGAEIDLHVKREHFLHGKGTGITPDMAIAAAAERIERQIEKLKGKWSSGRRQTPPVGEPAPAASRAAAQPNGRRIIRTRRYAVKPMSIEDAAAEIGDGSDAVIVFRNSASDTVTVLYRRPDGHLGLIEPER